MSYSFPSSFKKLKACVSCKILKTEGQWKESHFDCDNCGTIHEEKITSNHKGIIAITDTRHSWSAKWLDRVGFKPGLYCIYVEENEDDGLNEYEDEYDEEHMY
jgi:RNA polymerase subunit RPABC4/transcription elongation factor Spt4